MQKESVLVVVLALLAIVSLMMMISSSMTGYVSNIGTTSSNVSIIKYISISFSGNLSNGITFGSVASLPAADINASSNFNGASSASTYSINVSTDSNVAVDFCIQANTDLTDIGGVSKIGIGNETYLNSSTTNAALPGPVGSSVPLTTAYVKASGTTWQGNVTNYRFWLDIPSGTASGDYNNTISFKGVETTTSC